jgi:hypothetical protein
MNDDNQKPARSNDDLKAVLDRLALLGGEPLEGSGFESETPEPDADWRDPR